MHRSVPQSSPKANQITTKANKVAKVAREMQHLEMTSPKTPKLSSEATPSQNSAIDTLDFWKAARKYQEGPLPKLFRICVTPQEWESMDPDDDKHQRILHFLRYDEAKQEIWIIDSSNPDHHIPNSQIMFMVRSFVSVLPAAHQVHFTSDESTTDFVSIFKLPVVRNLLHLSNSDRCKALKKTGRCRDPDGGWRCHQATGQFKTSKGQQWPTVVLESGSSQSWADLKKDRDDWILTSQNPIQVVILVKMFPKDANGHRIAWAKAWRRNELAHDHPIPLVPHKIKFGTDVEACDADGLEAFQIPIPSKYFYANDSDLFNLPAFTATPKSSAHVLCGAINDPNLIPHLPARAQGYFMLDLYPIRCRLLDLL